MTASEGSSQGGDLDVEARLLAELVPEALEPIDPLLETLLRGRSAAEVLAGAPDAGLAMEEARPPSMERLIEQKTAAREAWRIAGTGAARDAALLRYLFAVADGLDRHGRNLSSLDPAMLLDWLGTLASVLEEPEAGRFARAADILEALLPPAA